MPPPDVVRHDGDDAYLVVAADKGTARFSDVANEVADGYGFWLGDAFASGGSVGYDHKAMGITARGAWESVRRHFRELGVDTQTEEFTVVGIGDMSGDVFGNGMLLSRAHPAGRGVRPPARVRRPGSRPGARATPSGAGCSPSPAPRGTTTTGPRSAPAAGCGRAPRRRCRSGRRSGPRSGCRTGSSTLSPPELIRAILGAPVDLLWNGGIGTYVKAAGETHAEVGDKANDAIRVDGARLRVRVVGEGGNLGATQRGRIEFARPAAGSTPTRSTTPPAWTAPTTRSTSRSCWTGWSRRASWTAPAGTRCWPR